MANSNKWGDGVQSIVNLLNALNSEVHTSRLPGYLRDMLELRKLRNLFPPIVEPIVITYSFEEQPVQSRYTYTLANLLLRIAAFLCILCIIDRTRQIFYDKLNDISWKKKKKINQYSSTSSFTYIFKISPSYNINEFRYGILESKSSSTNFIKSTLLLSRTLYRWKV